MSIELKVAEVIQKPVGRDISGVDYSFPTNGLADMLLFTDGTGTEVKNYVSDRPSGIIEHPTTS